MIFKYKFCLWLIDTLSIQPLTLPEIQKKWLNASANEDGDPLAERQETLFAAGKGIIDVRRHQM